MILDFHIEWFNSYNTVVNSRNNQPLYFSIGILFAITVIGPAIGYMMSSAMLRFYVDIDKTSGKSDMPCLLLHKLKVNVYTLLSLNNIRV